MKIILSVLICAVGALSLFGDAQTIIKQKAKDLRDSVSAPQPSKPSSPAQPAPRVAQPQQSQQLRLSPAQEEAVKQLYQELEKLKSQPASTTLENIQKKLAALKANSADIMNDVLIEKSTAALAEIWKKQTMPEIESIQVLKYIAILINSSNLSQQSIKAITYNIEKQLSSAGIEKEAVNNFLQLLNQIAAKNFNR
ncbi:MAG: hypothetical protein ACP5MG_06620 [Verrucomicrobiia bacterium]